LCESDSTIHPFCFLLLLLLYGNCCTATA
jgi:hypothetical protein